MRVLITDGNERSALAATRALGQQQLQVMVGAETARSLAVASKYCWQSFSYPSPYTDAHGFVSRLLDMVKRFQITTVFPISDIAVQLIGHHRKEFEESVIAPMPPIEVFEHLSDKYRLMQLASTLGVPIPDTVFVPSGRAAAVIDCIRHFPVVVKPACSLINVNGHWRKTAVHYATSAAELRQLYHDVDYLQQPSLIQRRIEGQGQGLFVLLNQGTPVALFAHRRLREKPPSGGVSVLRESIALPQPMTEYALRLLQHVGWHGVAMVEFKIDRQSGLPLLMEINGRFWGSLQLAIDAGMNFPYLLYQVATGQRVRPPANGYRVGVKTRWLLGDVDHLLSRLSKSATELHLPAGSPSKLQALLAFCRFYQRGMRYEILRFDDPKPFVLELRQYCSGLLRMSPQAKGSADDGGSVRRLARSIFRSISDPHALLARFYTRMIFLGNLQESMIYRTLPQHIRQLLFVCQGNICRSPLAMAYVEARLREGGHQISVCSAGLETTVGKEAHPVAKAVAQRHGLSLQAHVTTPLTQELVSQASLILVMEFAQRSKLLQAYPEAKGKVFQLGHFHGTALTEIADPYAGTPEDFAACYQVIRQSCDNLLQRLDTAR